MKRHVGTLVTALVFAGTLGVASADDPGGVLRSPASGTALAEPVWVAPELVSVINRGNTLTADVVAGTITAAQASYGTWALTRGASVSMHSVRRGGVFVQQAPGDFNYPMSVTAMPSSAVAQLMGRGLAGVVTNGGIIMGRTTADLRGAQAGDIVDILSAQGPMVSFVIGSVVDDAVIGGTEILMSTEEADSIGVTTSTRALIWGFQSRELIDQNLANEGLTGRDDVRIRHSWDPADPDSTLGMAQAKALLGEFAFRVQSNGVDVTVTGDWEATHMPPDREVLVASIPIRARCNLAIRGDLQAALTEVADAGLASQINVGNANTYGGCYYPRFNRTTGTLGFLSRHSWGQALDTNTDTNGQGATPQMNCDVVRIFRKHNFAWGGNFLIPDGMHFEWVGTRRDEYQYPSRYCPNLPAAPGTTTAANGPGGGAGNGGRGGTSVTTSGLSTMLVDDMLVDDGG